MVSLTKSRCKKEKEKDIIVAFHRSLEDLNSITYASVLNLPKCEGMVPQSRGTAGLFGPFLVALDILDKHCAIFIIQTLYDYIIIRRTRTINRLIIVL